MLFKKNIQKIINNSSNFLFGITDPLIITDKSLVIQYANVPFLKVMGYSETEVIDKMTCADVCKTPLCNTGDCTIKGCLEKKKAITSQTIAETRTGKKIPIRAACNAIYDDKGNAVGGFEIMSKLDNLDEGFLSNLADAAFRTDKDLVIQNINDAALKTLGYKREEVVGKMSCADLCRTPLCNTADCTIKKAMEKKETIVGTTVAQTKGGQMLPVRASCGYLSDAEGNVTGGFEVVSAIDKLDEGFLSILEDAAFRTDTKLIIQNINDAALKILGYRREEVIGKMTCGDLCRTPLCNTANCTIKNAMEKKTTVVGTTLVQTREGHLLPIRASCGYLTDADNKITGGFEVISVVNSLDEGFLSIMADAAFRTDKNLVIQNINEAALDFLGYQREEVVGKMTCADLCKTPVCNTADCTIKRCMRDKKTIVAETDAKTRSGKIVPVRASCGYLQDMKGNVTGGFEVISDHSAFVDLVGNMEDVEKGNLDTKVNGVYLSRTDSIGKLSNAVKNTTEFLNNIISDIVSVMKSIENGDLSIRIKEEHTKRNDIFGNLANAISNTTEKLSAMIGEVVMVAENVSTGSEALSSVSQQLSQGANEQASSVEETTSSMEQMSASIQQNSDNSQQTESIAIQAAKDAEESGQAVKQAVEAIKQIASKISIISEIARQTNMLALNAAIEAARAREHGKGFAVVAAEVRKLAENSQFAASEISELSSSSIKIVENAGTMLSKLVPDIQKTSQLVQEISASGREQNEGVKQINKALQQLNQVIQQNAASSEEMASTAEELSSQAVQLKDNTAFFKVDQTFRKNSNEVAQNNRIPHVQHLLAPKNKYSIEGKKLEFSGSRAKKESQGIILDIENDEYNDNQFVKY
jgi:methyl-accepting chemotaxis protein